MFYLFIYIFVNETEDYDPSHGHNMYRFPAEFLKMYIPLPTCLWFLCYNVKLDVAQKFNLSPCMHYEWVV